MRSFIDTLPLDQLPSKIDGFERMRLVIILNKVVGTKHQHQAREFFMGVMMVFTISKLLI